MSLTRSRFDQILSNAIEKNVLVIGDLMLDEYIYGTVDRISPEAPVPVLLKESTDYHLGGAANVAENLCFFGDGCINVHLAGIMGHDNAGSQLRDMLARRYINKDLVFTVRGHPTTVKTRFVAKGQQIVRVDQEKQGYDDHGTYTLFTQKVLKALNQFDAIILSDYNKGVLSSSLVGIDASPFVCDIIDRCSNTYNSLTIVDPPYGPIQLWSKYSGASYIKANVRELFATTVGESLSYVDGTENCARILLTTLNLSGILITRGEDGMVLVEQRFGPTNAHYIAPCSPRTIYDVSGAGDTVIAWFTAALLGGATPLEAAHISNMAASIAVSKRGTSVVTMREFFDLLEERFQT